METKKELTIVLWVIVFIGAFFLAKGITGNATLSMTVSDYCTTDHDCMNGKVCCVTAEGNGMCNDSNFLCDRITNSTKENPLKKGYGFDIIFGIITLLCVLIAFYAHERNGKTRKMNKSSVKRKIKRNKVVKKKRR